MTSPNPNCFNARAITCVALESLTQETTEGEEQTDCQEFHFLTGLILTPHCNTGIMLFNNDGVKYRYNWIWRHRTKKIYMIYDLMIYILCTILHYRFCHVELAKKVIIHFYCIKYIQRRLQYRQMWKGSHGSDKLIQFNFLAVECRRLWRIKFRECLFKSASYIFWQERHELCII